MKIGRLLMLMLFPALAFAQQAYYGSIATGVRLSVEGNPADLSRIPIHAGETITVASVRDAIQALYGTGHYEAIDVEAVASGNGTQLTFVVKPHYFFSTFTLEPANLLDRSLSSVLRLPVGQRVAETSLQEVIDQTTKTLQDRGYFGATVTSVLGPDNDRHLRTVLLKADIPKPERARIGTVNLSSAAGALTPVELRKAFDISEGDIFSADQIDKGLARIRERLVEKNFLNTHASATTQYDPVKNTVNLDVSVDAGQKTVIDTGHKIPDREVRKLIPIFEEGEFDEDLVKEGHTRIIEYEQQQGFFEATVDGPDIMPASGGNPLRISFVVMEGERHRVRSIGFVGNTVFSTDSLKERIKAREAGLFTHGLASDKLLDADVQTIQSMYRRAGYEAAFVEWSREDNANHDIDIIFNIIENQRFPIETITIAGNQELTESELKTALRLKERDFYGPAEADDARTRLMAYYYDHGFPDVRVEATADRNPDTNGRLLRYQISEGEQYRVGELYVVGNTRTDVNLIKRASKLKEYAFFNPEDVLAAQQKLYATGFFARVDVVPLDYDNGNLRTILIQVEEAKAITVTPGVGYKEDVGPRLTLDISNSNILGGGRSLGLRFRFGRREQQFQTTYREPRLFNHETLDGSGTLTAENTDRPQYQARRLELSLQVRKRFTQTNSFVSSASYQTVNTQDIKLSEPQQRLAALEKGIIHIARFGASYISDHRDPLVDPKRGLLNTSTFQIAGRAWGSEVNFVSVAHQASYFKPQGIGTLGLSARLGWKLPYGQDNELPITERYFAGGSTTLRGFDLDEAGPPGGGQLLTIGNVEYRVPIKKISIGELGTAVFYDTGNVFEKPSNFSLGDFTHSGGAGLRFQTPLGPVRFDVGFNLHPRLRLNPEGHLEREKRTKIFFTLGHAF
jgi:outer membrane protein insertion porin family